MDASNNAIKRNKIQIFLHAPFHSDLKKISEFKPKNLADSNYTDLSLEKGDFAILTQAFTLHTY